MRGSGDATPAYGQELIIDLGGCEVHRFRRDWLEIYLAELCQFLDMKRAELHFWDDHGVPEEERQTEPHTKGTTVVQFILTSNITIHTLDLLGEVYVNIFSCKEFDWMKAAEYTRRFFGGNFMTDPKVIPRGEGSGR